MFAVLARVRMYTTGEMSRSDDRLRIVIDTSVLVASRVVASHVTASENIDKGLTNTDNHCTASADVWRCGFWCWADH